MEAGRRRPKLERGRRTEACEHRRKREKRGVVKLCLPGHGQIGYAGLSLENGPMGRRASCRRRNLASRAESICANITGISLREHILLSKTVRCFQSSFAWCEGRLSLRCYLARAREKEMPRGPRGKKGFARRRNCPIRVTRRDKAKDERVQRKEGCKNRVRVIFPRGFAGRRVLDGLAAVQKGQSARHNGQSEMREREGNCELSAL